MATENDPACVSLGSIQNVNRASVSDLGPGSPWSQCHSRFASVDVPSPMVHHQGSFPLLGRLTPSAPNPYWAPRYAYGAPNGSLDNRSLSVFHGAFRPLLSSSLSLALPFQRCRDFEEQGYCLRGDTCPMEHGENRIVVEDVQSLALFDLRSSILAANMPGTSGVAGPRPLANVTSVMLSNDKGPHRKSTGGITGEGLVWNSAYPSSTDDGGEADIYDPDEPLFLLPLKSDEAEMVTNDVSAHCVGGSSEVYTRDKTNGTSLANLPYWRRVAMSGSAVKEKTKLESALSLPKYFENETTSESHFITSRSKSTDPSLKTQDDATPARKKNKKAERSLFVTAIPQQNNTMQSLLSHFRRFGVVTHIHIPENSGRAFIQFSTREEAKAALRAPDAVMGNRFIKLFWANRDNVLNNATSGGSTTYMTSNDQRAGLGPCHVSILNRGKENIQHAAKVGNVKYFRTSSSRRPREIKSGTADVARVLPPLKKKLASVEQLKEELRQKREMLDQKQKDFKRQLEKLEKQVVGVKGDVAAEQSAKRQKVVSACDIEKSANLGPACTGSVPVSYNAINVLASSNAKVTDSEKKSAENAANPKTNLLWTSQEPTSFPQPICHTAPPDTSLVRNKYQLDTCRTAFKIIPPLPSGLANVAALKEHFSSYGELSHVELENIEVNDGPAGSQTSKKCSACIRFTTRESAQRAFMHGKCWKGHYMQFLWLKSNDNVPPAKEVSDPDELLSNQHAPISSHATTASGDRKLEILENKLMGIDSQAGEVC